MAFIRNTDKLIEGVVNQFFTDSRARTAVITQLITNGVTDRSPSEDAVFDALALKLDTSLKGSVNGLAELDAGGKVPLSQLPDTAIIDVQVVANEAARLALSPQEGDVALQSDNSKAYIYDGSAWQEITKDAFAKAAAVVNSSAGSETDQAMSVSAGKSYSESQKVEGQKFLGDLEVFSSNGSIDGDNMVCLVDLTGGSVTLTLPNIAGLTAGRKYIIKDQKGLATQSVFITVQRQGSSELIDGASSYEMKAAYESISVMFDGTNWLVF